MSYVQILTHIFLASVVICFFISLAPFHTQRLFYLFQEYRLINELFFVKLRVRVRVRVNVTH